MATERLRRPVRADLDADGQAVWDSVAGTRGAVIGPDGALVGPFNAWVQAPEVGRRIVELGAVLRFGSALERRLLEVAIISVGAHWKAEFEWWAHARMALENGVSEATVEAIAAGGRAELDRDDEQLVHDVAVSLVTTGTLDDGTYERAAGLLDTRGLVELISLCGYYSMVSFTLNAFRVPVPDGAEARWPQG